MQRTCRHAAVPRPWLQGPTPELPPQRTSAPARRSPRAAAGDAAAQQQAHPQALLLAVHQAQQHTQESSELQAQPSTAPASTPASSSGSSSLDDLSSSPFTLEFSSPALEQAYCSWQERNLLHWDRVVAAVATTTCFRLAAPSMSTAFSLTTLAALHGVFVPVAWQLLLLSSSAHSSIRAARQAVMVLQRLGAALHAVPHVPGASSLVWVRHLTSLSHLGLYTVGAKLPVGRDAHAELALWVCEASLPCAVAVQHATA